MSRSKSNISRMAGSKRMESTLIQCYAIGLTLNNLIDFAFSPCLSVLPIQIFMIIIFF